MYLAVLNWLQEMSPLWNFLTAVGALTAGLLIPLALARQKKREYIQKRREVLKRTRLAISALHNDIKLRLEEIKRDKDSILFRIDFNKRLFEINSWKNDITFIENAEYVIVENLNYTMSIALKEPSEALQSNEKLLNILNGEVEKTLIEFEKIIRSTDKNKKNKNSKKTVKT